MKITQIAGFLGCGKTTLLLKLSRMLLGDNERKVALVVNEIGEIPVDGKIMEESGMQVKDIGGGCICCEVASSFAKTLTQLYKSYKPDHILVEPTGVAVPHQVFLALPYLASIILMMGLKVRAGQPANLGVSYRRT